MNDAMWLWIAKGTGAMAGSAISITYMLPKGRREAAARFAVGVTCGLVFGGTVGLKIAADLDLSRMIGSTEIVLMGSAAASLCAWWAIGFLTQAMRVPKGSSEDGSSKEPVARDSGGKHG